MSYDESDEFSPLYQPEGVYHTQHIINIINAFTIKLSLNRYKMIDDFIIYLNDISKTIINFKTIYYDDYDEYYIFTFFEKLFEQPLEIIIDIIEYMLIKGYIIKSDDEFQQMIIEEITRFHHSIAATEKYLYCCKEYLIPDNINKYLCVKSYNDEIITFSLLCRVINTGTELSEENINRIFSFFDSISFVYTNPLYTHLMYFALSSWNILCIEKLVERGLTFDIPIIIELLFNQMRMCIISMQTQTELNFNRKNTDNDRINCEFFKFILQGKRIDLLKEFFTDDETNDKERSDIIIYKINEIIQQFGIPIIGLDFTNRFNSNNSRTRRFIIRSSLIEFIKLYKLLDRCHFDFSQKFTKLEGPTSEYIQLDPMTLYDLYMHGSFSIQILYLDLHQELKYILCQDMIKCIKIFKKIPDVIIQLIISYV